MNYAWLAGSGGAPSVRCLSLVSCLCLALLRDVGLVPGSAQVAEPRLCHKPRLRGSCSFLDLFSFFFSWHRREGFLLLQCPSVKINLFSILYFLLLWIKEAVL